MTARTVLITGGNRGIGFSLAEEFVAAGHRVAVTARNGAGPAGSLTVIADVTDGASLDRAFAEVEEKLKAMEEELVVYEDLNALRHKAAQQRSDALAAKADAEGKIGALKARAAQAKKNHDDLKDKLAKDDVATALDELEAKIRHQEQTIWVLTEYIETKGSEAFFEPVAEECLNIIQGINAETISVLQQRPAYNPALMNPY